MIKLNYCAKCGNKLIKKLKEGRKRYICPQCKCVHYQNPRPVAASIVYFKNKILLIKRKIEPKKNHWAFPCGFIELKETPLAAAKRELFEETNIIAEDKARLLGVYYDTSKIYSSVIVISYLFLKFKGNMKPGDDAIDCDFFDINKKLPELAFKSHKQALSSLKKYLKNNRIADK